MNQMKKNSLLWTSSSEETLEIGFEIGKCLKVGSIVCFKGDLGSGKTTLIKGIAKSLNIDVDVVVSPTFSYLNQYNTIAHFDLYRIASKEAFIQMGFEEYLEPPFITLIEWPEIITTLLPPHTGHIQISHLGEDMREIEVFL